MREFSKEPLWRGRAEGGSAREHEVRGRHEIRSPGTKAYSKGSDRSFPYGWDAATKPFIYLSAVVSNAEFSETLELAGESGVKFNGVLCGRATWKDGIPVYAKKGAGGVPQVA